MENIVNQADELTHQIKDNQELFDLAKEEGDKETLKTIQSDTEKISKLVEDVEFKRMFSNPMDPNNCFIDFQSGSGGTEAQDWANMLLRMYIRYAEQKSFKVEVLELSDGEVAGIKGASIKISGDFAYGYFRTESGIHRLVRKSPFDSGSRRHTSFAGVNVFPEIDDSIEIDVKNARKSIRDKDFTNVRIEEGFKRIQEVVVLESVRQGYHTIGAIVWTTFLDKIDAETAIRKLLEKGLIVQNEKRDGLSKIPIYDLSDNFAEKVGKEKIGLFGITKKKLPKPVKNLKTMSQAIQSANAAIQVAMNQTPQQPQLVGGSGTSSSGSVASKLMSTLNPLGRILK